MKKFFMQHLEALNFSAKKIWQAPLANLMTIAVIAIALALPTALYVFLQNVKLIGNNWDASAQVSVYLKQGISSEQISMLLQQLNDNAEIAKATYISPEQGLKEFEAQSDFGEVLTQLNQNPLPGVIVVNPSLRASAPQALQELVSHLQKLTEVDSVQLDMIWVQRLFALIQFAKRVVWALGGLLAIAVLLIIGNTLRLAIQNSRHEIEVIKLVGGTNAFIRRPFLYTGILFGLSGAFMALMIVNIVLFWLSGPITRLVGLYQSQFHLSTLDFSASGLLILFGVVLGMLGSWFAVSKQLNLIEPG